MTRISVTDSQLTKMWRHNLKDIQHQYMAKKSQQNNSSISDKNMLVKKQHAILNVDFVKLIPKMLTISSAPVVLRC